MKSTSNKLKAPIAAFGASQRNDTDNSSNSQGQAIVGVKGQKYGLQVRSTSSTATKKAPLGGSVSGSGVRTKQLLVFAAASAEADHDSETDERRKRLMATGDAQKKKVIIIMISLHCYTHS
jgi:hypothetical protein